jgi:hypothetical protein
LMVMPPTITVSRKATRKTLSRPSFSLVTLCHPYKASDLVGLQLFTSLCRIESPDGPSDCPEFILANSVVHSGAQILFHISGKQPLCSIFDHMEVIPVGDLRDPVHLTPDAGIVDSDDGFRLVCNGSFDKHLIDIERVGSDVDEYGHAAAKDKGVGGRPKGKGGHDNLVTGLYIAEDCRHLKDTGAQVRKQRLLAAQVFFKPLMALPCEGSVSRKVAVCHRLGDVVQLLVDDEGLVKRSVKPLVKGVGAGDKFKPKVRTRLLNCRIGQLSGNQEIFEPKRPVIFDGLEEGRSV